MALKPAGRVIPIHAAGGFIRHGPNTPLNTLRDASKEALSGLADDIRTTNTRAWQPFSNSITDASLKFSNELTPASDYAFTTATTGLSGLNTGFGTVNTAAASLFNQTGTGFGNSLVAAQNYQENGLNMLGLTLGNQLPASLGIFQTSHDTSFGQMQGVTSAAYTKMGLAAHDFFDDVGFHASQVLGGLVTGEIDSWTMPGKSIPPDKVISPFGHFPHSFPLFGYHNRGLVLE